MTTHIYRAWNSPLLAQARQAKTVHENRGKTPGMLAIFLLILGSQQQRFHQFTIHFAPRRSRSEVCKNLCHYLKQPSDRHELLLKQANKST